MNRVWFACNGEQCCKHSVRTRQVELESVWQLLVCRTQIPVLCWKSSILWSCYLSTHFLTFVCHEQYGAVLLSHDPISTESTVRSVNSDFGILKYSDIWIATSETKTFMSNHVSTTYNDGHFNTINGLSDPRSESFKFSIYSEEVVGEIELTGEEHQVLNAYLGLCDSQWKFLRKLKCKGSCAYAD